MTPAYSVELALDAGLVVGGHDSDMTANRCDNSQSDLAPSHLTDKARASNTFLSAHKFRSTAAQRLFNRKLCGCVPRYEGLKLSEMRFAVKPSRNHH